MVALTCSLPCVPLVHSTHVNFATRFFIRGRAKVMDLECMNKKKKKTSIVASSSIHVLTTKTIDVSPENTSTGEESLQRNTSTSPPLPLPRKSTSSLQYESGFLGAVPDKRKWSRESNDEEGRLSVIDYLMNILSSKQVYGVAVKEVGQETFRLCRELVDGVVLVSREAICASMKDMFEEKRSILEPAGAIALAGAEAYCKYYGLKGESVVAITSEANMNFNSLRMVTKHLQHLQPKNVGTC